MKTLKNIAFTVGLVLIHISGFTQIANPVKWAFAATKKDNLIYLFTAKATIEKGWHIYAQKQPKEAISTPTSFQFTANPLLLKGGPVKEQGKLVFTSDPVTGIASNEYHNQVVFTQVFKLKKPVKTVLKGKVTFMACTSEMCLPAEDVAFSVELK